MRSLAIKLTLAFLFVGLIGAILVALVVRQSTHSAFDRFMQERNVATIAETLSDYYKIHGGWEGVAQVFRADGTFRPQFQAPENFRDGYLPQLTFILVGTDRTIIYSRKAENIGNLVTQPELNKATAIEVNGDTVGWVVFQSPPEPWALNTPEGVFLRNINRAILISAIVAGLIALVLGGFLAYTMTRSLRELKAGTQKVAAGDLGYQVEVRSDDELGDLAVSFNQMSADLARANQTRRQMTADIAHDLRSPLSVILGYTEALSDNKLEGTPEVFEVMYKEAGQLNHLIDDLRTLSLADAGELALNYQSIYPLEILQDVARAYRQQAERKGVSLGVDVANDTPHIKVDPNRMIQVLGNLVDNAIRYTQEGGEIRLGAHDSGEASGDRLVELYVADTGAGITAEDLPFIFSRFYRSDKSRQDNGETGLGLAIAKSLVETQGGSISVESMPGSGSRFTIRFPAEA